MMLNFIPMIAESQKEVEKVKDILNKNYEMSQAKFELDNVKTERADGRVKEEKKEHEDADENDVDLEA